MTETKKRSSNAKGFTLIELLVVVAIIGILAAILIPGLMKKTVDAKVQASNANAAQVYNAAALAAQQMAIADFTFPADGIVATGNGGTATAVVGAKAGDPKTFSEYVAEELGSQFKGDWRVSLDKDGNVTFALWSMNLGKTTEQLNKQGCATNKGTIGCHPLSD